MVVFPHKGKSHNYDMFWKALVTYVYNTSIQVTHGGSLKIGPRIEAYGLYGFLDRGVESLSLRYECLYSSSLLLGKKKSLLRGGGGE